MRGTLDERIQEATTKVALCVAHHLGIVSASSTGEIDGDRFIVSIECELPPLESAIARDPRGAVLLQSIFDLAHERYAADAAEIVSRALGAQVVSSRAIVGSEVDGAGAVGIDFVLDPATVPSATDFDNPEGRINA